MIKSDTSFGTSVNVNLAKDFLTTRHRESFLDGLIVATNKLRGNRIKDELTISAELSDKNKKYDKLIFNYKSDKGKEAQNPIIIEMKKIPRRMKNVENFILKTFRDLQPEELQLKTVHLISDGYQDKKTISEAKVSGLFKN